MALDGNQGTPSDWGSFQRHLQSRECSLCRVAPDGTILGICGKGLELIPAFEGTSGGIPVDEKNPNAL